jgi:hypothetical protein
MQMNLNNSDNFTLSLSNFDKPFSKRFADFKSRQKGDYEIKECGCK